jgi:heterodisulfide reductase subunit A
MENKKRIGVIFCDPPIEYGRIDYSDLVNFSRADLKIPVVIGQTKYLFSDFQVLLETVSLHELTSIVLAGIQPGRFLPMVRKAMIDNGHSAWAVQAVDFQAIWVKGSKPGEKVFSELRRTCQKVADDADSRRGPNQSTMIIGGGIAGIQASLEIARAGLKVHLVEKSATIGGHMAMFDKTFPTLDCAACILTPKMVEVGQDPNIQMHTYSEVLGVEGEAGNFKVRILHRARRVNLKSCIGCGTCAEKCPSKTKSEFDSGTSLRKAIYIPFPQAVPNKYLIDENVCRYVQENKCGVCVKVCPVENCIDLDEKDQVVEIEVGNIIVATGFSIFDASRLKPYGYGSLPNVLTSLEFERLINAAGPTGGNIVFRTQDKKGNWIFEKGSPEPRKVGIIHCVGSRDENHNSHCSKVCCMYSLKLAHLVKEKLPEAEVYEYYIDMRAFGKGYEEFYNRIKKEGINIIRGRTASVKEYNGHMMMRSEDLIRGRLIEQEVDMVILSVGLEPVEESSKIADLLNIEVDERGWFKSSSELVNPVGTVSPGIYIAGVCQGPKDIPDTVAEASAAASSVLKDILGSQVFTGNIKLKSKKPSKIL